MRNLTIKLGSGSVCISCIVNGCRCFVSVVAMLLLVMGMWKKVVCMHWCVSRCLGCFCSGKILMFSFCMCCSSVSCRSLSGWKRFFSIRWKS